MAGIAGLLRQLFVGREHGWRARRRRGADDPSPSAPTPEPVAPDGFHAVASSAELLDGQVIEVRAAGVPLAVARIDGELSAVSAVCPHAGGPLADGLLEGETLTCPLHGWSYDMRTGACLVDPNSPVPAHQVIERDGMVYASERAIE